MYIQDQYKPKRQTMQNVKPSDYVPFEDAVIMNGHHPYEVFSASQGQSHVN